MTEPDVHAPRPRRSRMHLAVGVLLVAILVALAASRPGYPTTDEVHAVIAGLGTQSARDRRIALVTLVGRLSHIDGLFDGPEDAVRHDRIAEASLRSLVDVYRAHHAPEFLDALDAAELDGGFANLVCEAYLDVLAEELARVRYRRDRAPLRRCNGITFDEAELARLLGDVASR